MDSCLCSICGAKLSDLFAHRAHHFIEHATAKKPVAVPSNPSRLPTLEQMLAATTLDENSNQLSHISLNNDKYKAALKDVDRLTQQIKQITLEQRSSPVFVLNKDENRMLHYKMIHRIARTAGCKECGKEFESHRQLNYHVFTEHSQKFFTCDICDQFFYEDQLLQRHIKVTHDNELRPHICQYCQKGFPSRYAMRSHERQHTNETPYRCAICNQVFREDASLKSHWKFKHITELQSLQRSRVKIPTKRPPVRNQPALISHHARLHQ